MRLAAADSDNKVVEGLEVVVLVVAEVVVLVEEVLVVVVDMEEVAGEKINLQRL